MLNKRGDRDYSKDAELLKNGDFHEYKGGRGEFLLIQSYDMFVSTLTQAAVRARTFAPGVKMSVLAVVTTPGHKNYTKVSPESASHTEFTSEKWFKVISGDIFLFLM